MQGGLVGTGVGTGFGAAPAEGLEPDPPEFFSGQEVDDEVGRRVEADEEVRQVEAGLHERGHNAWMALVGAEIVVIVAAQLLWKLCCVENSSCVPDIDDSGTNNQ